MTFANFPELGRALTQQCSRAVLPEQEFAFLQRIVLKYTNIYKLSELYQHICVIFIKLLVFDIKYCFIKSCRVEVILVIMFIINCGNVAAL